MSLKYEFNYGCCHTDYKDGFNIDKSIRGFDYVYGSEYGLAVKEMLDKLNLPLPDKDKIFRGRFHDLLPLDSHGLMIRIGVLEPAELVGPAVLQPLGWLSNREIFCESKLYFVHPLTVAIYPGIELMSTVTSEYNWKEFMRNNSSAVRQFGQTFSDEGIPHNYGVVRVNSNEDKSEIVPLILDVDNGSIEYIYLNKKDVKPNLYEAFNRAANKAEVMKKFINKRCRKIQGQENYVKAFEVHQPLRNLFWDCYKKGNMDRFYNTCAESTAKNGAKNPILFADWADVTKKPKYPVV